MIKNFLSLFCVLILFFGFCGKKQNETIVEDNRTNSVAVEEEKRLLSAEDIDEYQSLFISLFQIGVDEYINVENYPWNYSAYSIKNWDKVSNKIAVFANLPVSGIPEKQLCLVVFTTDGKRYTIHTVCCGEKIYKDDGTYQQIIDILTNSIEN